MNKDIKETIDYFEKYLNIDDMIRFDKLLDYITNLQQIEKDHQKLNGLLHQEIERLNNIIDGALGIANERINYYNHKQIEAEDWSEIFNILAKRDNQELKG